MLVEARLEPERPDARYVIGRAVGSPAVVWLPSRSDTSTVVEARVGKKLLASTVLVVKAEPCPSRLKVVARRISLTMAQVRVALFGELADGDDVVFRYDFGQGASETTTARSVEFDYGAAAEGRNFVITVTAEAKALVAPEARTIGFARVAIPRADGLKDLAAELRERQQRQNALAEKRGWRSADE